MSQAAQHKRMDALPFSAELAARNKARFPSESAEYRKARTVLLAEEIELRRHIERVAEQRRALAARPRGEGLPFCRRGWRSAFH